MKRIILANSPAGGAAATNGNHNTNISSTTTSRRSLLVSPSALSSAAPPGPPPLFFSTPRWLTARTRSLQRQRSRPKTERVAVAGMLLIAWAWIMVFFGVIFYHGYQYRGFAGGGRGAGDHRAVEAAVVEPAAVVAAAAAGGAQHRITNHKEQQYDKVERIRPDAAGGAPAAAERDEKPFHLEPQASPLLIFTCNRAEYLHETLLDVLKFIPSDCSMGCPVVVSQDGNNPDVKKVIAEYQTKFLERKGIALVHLEHKSALRRGTKGSSSYQALAVHYGWALRQVFDGHALASQTARPPQRVVILEEDLHIAPDFFDYFAAMAPVLESDPSLLAVSAFNDNGFQETVRDRTRVLRSDFFPGLGWMMTRKLWTNELQLKWPAGWWDDWLRDPAQRQGRHVLRPEVSRTFHFGTKGGASGNQFGAQLSQVFLNDQAADWTPRAVENKNNESGAAAAALADKDHWSWYLQNEATFDLYYWGLIEKAHLATTVEAAEDHARHSDVRLEYEDFEHFQQIVQQLHQPLMDDEKATVPRTAYKGVVETRPHGQHLLFLTPPLKQVQAAFGAKTIAEKPPAAR